MAEAVPSGVPAVPPMDTLVQLYNVEAGLIQQKATHILTIRSVAIAAFAGILAGVAVYPNRQLQLLSLILLPFYVLDFVYDAYLIPIVHRESELRRVIAGTWVRQGGDPGLISAYGANIDHRVTPTSWNPFLRAALEPVRVLFYSGLVIIPIVVVVIAPHL